MSGVGVDKGEEVSSRPDGALGADEHPSLDDEPGFWAEKWTEFKRRFK